MVEQEDGQAHSAPWGKDSEARLQRLCIELLLLSMGILLAAMLWTYQIGLDANNTYHSLYHVSENLKGIRENVARMEAEQLVRSEEARQPARHGDGQRQ